MVHAGRRLALANYGTGAHQVVILAAAATVLSGHLICVDEPEVTYTQLCSESCCGI